MLWYKLFLATSLKLDGDCVGDLSDRTVNCVPTLTSNNNSINDKNDQMFPETHGSLPVKNASLHDGIVDIQIFFYLHYSIYWFDYL